MHECDNCGAKWADDGMDQIEDYWQRLDPGGVVPSGQCPDCGALCYPTKGVGCVSAQRPATLA